MNMKKILSAFLVLTFLLGAIVECGLVNVNAAYSDKIDAKGNPVINYFTKEYRTDEEKLKDMTLFKEANGYQIWVEEFTGEVAFVNSDTGDAIFSNPYDVGVKGNVNSNAIKQTLLSQIILTYSEKSNTTQVTMNSYQEAACRNQIKTKNIKNGLRMEYTIGEVQVTRLVPRRISKERFESLIYDKVVAKNEFHAERLLSFYTLYDASDTSLTETLVKEMEAAFPITKRMAIYVCAPEITVPELKQLERYIKTYCPLYTLDEMEQDHNETGYVGVDIAPPCFRLAIEYTMGENGALDVRLPANGIRFDESVYTLGTISVLPYMGAGNTNNEGYAFIPDGSGAIIRYADVKGINSSISGQMYGSDYAYHSVKSQHEQTMRYPVFGNVVNLDYKYTQSSNSLLKSESGGESVSIKKDVGYVAIITEGDPMAQIIQENGGQLHKYNTVYARFTPRPSDTYNLADSVSIGENASWTVVSDRKYSGSYRIKYILLSSSGKEGSYECSYVGMAKAYRDYLISNGLIKKLESSEVKDDIPLYVETFGSIETTEKFLSFPVNVDTPLTSFKDVETMYDELSEKGVKNINFRLTGYTNGGLDCTYPGKVEWVSALGGKSGFKNLLAAAENKGFSLYPDFDFAYVAKTAYFDGINAKKDYVKTIDDRYTSRKYYDSATQSLENDVAKAISPSRYEYFCSKFTSAYSDYDNPNVSVSTLGTDLNSDFDKKDPYNRQDSKNFTVEMLASLSESFGNIMVDGGNAYSIPYADHIIGVSTDSSNYMTASQSVPFAGFILHGYTNFTGGAINMEGDVDYAILKSVENGASLFYTLSYENTNDLKESSYNDYYSVNYENWKDEVANQYLKVNEAMKDLQTSVIDDHSFISGYRVPTAEAIAADEAEVAAENEITRKANEEAKAKRALDEKLAARKGVTIPGTVNNTKPEKKVVTKTTEDGIVYCTNDKYKTSIGTLVKVKYDNGTSFIINYNSFDVVVNEGGKDAVVSALGFLRID